MDDDIRRDCSIFGLGQVQQEGYLKAWQLIFFKILTNNSLKISSLSLTRGRPTRRVTHHKEKEEKLNSVDQKEDEKKNLKPGHGQGGQPAKESVGRKRDAQHFSR
jgi:hypothetical protein